MELFALADKLGGNLELAIKRLAESKRIPIINNLKIRNMKWIDNLIYTLLSACLLAGCEDSGSKELERMQGYWVHVRGTPGFHTLGNGRQIHRHPESECQGQNTGNGLPGNRTERLPVHRNGLPHTVHL